jgi:uncharacterized membrane protein YgcG
VAAAILIGQFAGGWLACAVWGDAALLAWRIGRTASAWATAWPGWLAIGLTALQIALSAVAVAILLLLTFVLAALVPSLIDLLHDPALPGIAGAGAVYGLATLLFGRIMAAPARAGQRLRDRIEGFRIYMKAAEERPLNARTPPDRTPERFERLLPCAVAPGLTQNWAARFDDVLAVAPVSHFAWLDLPGGFDLGDLFGPRGLGRGSFFDALTGIDGLFRSEGSSIGGIGGGIGGGFGGFGGGGLGGGGGW